MENLMMSILTYMAKATKLKASQKKLLTKGLTVLGCLFLLFACNNKCEALDEAELNTIKISGEIACNEEENNEH